VGQSTIKSLDKALDILFLFLAKRQPLGVTEISKELSLYKSNVHRILATYQARGFVTQDPETKRYWLGSKFFSLGMLYKSKFKLSDIVRKHLEEIGEEFKETVHLAIFDEMDYSQVISVDKIQATHRLSAAPPIGSRSPSHASAVGKALLTFSPAEVREAVLSKKLQRFTANTITKREKLEAEFAKIAKRGYSRDREELEYGLYCLAVPILNKEREAIASISVSGPKKRVQGAEAEIVARLQAAVQLIQREIE